MADLVEAIAAHHLAFTALRGRDDCAVSRAGCTGVQLSRSDTASAGCCQAHIAVSRESEVSMDEAIFLLSLDHPNVD